MVFRRVARTLVVLFALLMAYPAGKGPHFSDWSAPVNLGSIVNSEFADQAPAVRGAIPANPGLRGLCARE